jgi:hypothetical protein
LVQVAIQSYNLSESASKHHLVLDLLPAHNSRALAEGDIVNRRDFVSRVLGAATSVSIAARHNWALTPSHPLSTDTPGNSARKWTMAGPNLRVDIGGDGTIQTLEVKAAGEREEVKFRSGILAGPAWAGVQLHRLTEAEAHFTGTADGVRHSLLYRLENNRLAIIASIQNERLATYAPKAARLVIGIDCEMRSFPSWNDRYFPTLLRCEKSHFGATDDPQRSNQHDSHSAQRECRQPRAFEFAEGMRRLRYIC